MMNQTMKTTTITLDVEQAGTLYKALDHYKNVSGVAHSIHDWTRLIYLHKLAKGAVLILSIEKVEGK